MRRRPSYLPALLDGTWRIADEARGECTVSEHFAARPAIPVCGVPPKVHCNSDVEMDAPLTKELPILHIVDVHTHCHAALFSPTAEAGLMLDTFQDAWLLHYEGPRNVTMEKRDEFFLD